jgi:hypothetical protein
MLGAIIADIVVIEKLEKVGKSDRNYGQLSVITG